MTVVKMDQRHRITTPKELRKRISIVKGQKFYVLQYGEDLLMKAIPKNAVGELDKIVGGFEFDKAAKRRAERLLLDQNCRKSS